jgi:hypothetical protein
MGLQPWVPPWGIESQTDALQRSSAQRSGFTTCTDSSTRPQRLRVALIPAVSRELSRSRWQAVRFMRTKSELGSHPQHRAGCLNVSAEDYARLVASLSSSRLW